MTFSSSEMQLKLICTVKILFGVRSASPQKGYVFRFRISPLCDGGVGSIFFIIVQFPPTPRSDVKTWFYDKEFFTFFSFEHFFYCKNEMCNPKKKYFGIVGCEELL